MIHKLKKKHTLSHMPCPYQDVYKSSSSLLHNSKDNSIFMWKPISKQYQIALVQYQTARDRDDCVSSWDNLCVIIFFCVVWNLNWFREKKVKVFNWNKNSLTSAYERCGFDSFVHDECWWRWFHPIPLKFYLISSSYFLLKIRY